MGLHEIDHLLKNSRQLIQASDLSLAEKKQLVWNLEVLPDRYEMDAGGFRKDENSSDFEYKGRHAYALGLAIAQEAHRQQRGDLIYEWSGFLLNWGQAYFMEEAGPPVEVEREFLAPLKALFHRYDHNGYKTHRSLTISDDGTNWSTEEELERMAWFLSARNDG